jgi:tRNA (guanine37-N1)-methyltransferase
MVLRVDVVDWALQARYGADPLEVRERRRVVALTPGGRVLDEDLVVELAAEEELTLLCGRYEGFDERILEHFCTDRVSIGRYVLAGGELAAMVVLDAVLRKLPGALGHEGSAHEESFSAALEGLPEYPHYTRPASYRGWDVPDVLLSGHHARVEEWRRAESRRRAEGPG